MEPLVLIVDDNPINLKLAVNVLESDGFQVAQAGDAEQALDAIKRAKPTLILMDIAMPGMDGLALTRKLKSDPQTKDIIIVALTAFAMKGDEQKAYAAGCDGYIAKPIDTRKFTGQVKKFLKATRAHAKIIPGQKSLAVEPARRTASGFQMNILVIENDPASLKLAEIVLREDDNQVRGAVDARQGLDEIAREKPEVILLDLALPVVDGLTLARQIKNHPETQDIFIIAFTSFPEQFRREDALAAGCDAYLLKPMDTRSLHSEIEALFKKKSE